MSNLGFPLPEREIHTHDRVTGPIGDRNGRCDGHGRRPLPGILVPSRGFTAPVSPAIRSNLRNLGLPRPGVHPHGPVDWPVVVDRPSVGSPPQRPCRRPERGPQAAHPQEWVRGEMMFLLGSPETHPPLESPQNVPAGGPNGGPKTWSPGMPHAAPAGFRLDILPPVTQADCPGTPKSWRPPPSRDSALWDSRWDPLKIGLASDYLGNLPTWGHLPHPSTLPSP